ncbi:MULTISPECIES: DUF5712 family protein [unclassified Dysgonomonas]|uniref:DUF5712 family protein n=1 Tax=unclassified Dysgonomonas TaxID=2630389 RepID=UPI0024742553|nr:MULTISPECIES: DUF5712 family protein [unclassified Dysgonomonas]
MPRGLNSGSSKALVEYLDKEEKGFFFDKNDEKATSHRVQKEIDGHVNKLGKNEDKFYMLSFSPSKDELRQMVGRDVSSIEQLTFEEKTKLFSDLRGYTHDAMDIYAQSFNRENVRNGKDLMYFARIETERTYNHYDKDVQSGKANTGDKKDGLQLHIHVIVSRKSADDKAKLSPNIRFRNCQFKNGTQKEVTRGFNYTDFTEKCSAKFTEKFNIQTRANHNKGVQTQSFISSGANRLTNTVKNKAKNQLRNEILKDSFHTERQIAGNVMKVASIGNKIVNIASASNPVTAVKPIAELAVNAIKTIHRISTSGL